MTDIKDILTQQEVAPSPDCWDKISGRLDVLMPQGAEQAVSQATTSSTGHVLGSLTAKIVAGVIGATAVATVVTIAVTGNKHPQPVEEPQVIVTDSVSNIQDNGDTISYDSKPVSPAVLEYPETPYSSSVESSVSTDNQTAQENKPAMEHVEATPHLPLAPPSPPAPSSPLTPSSSLVPPSSHAPSVTVPAKSQQTTTRPVAQSVKQDPVIQDLAEDAVDWTPPIKLVIPNVFTPNGDGYNDRFVIEGLDNCIQRQLVVRNRAGQIVYRNNSYENTWDGGDCPDGVYNYQFIYKGDNGIEQTMSGTVYIIRR